MTSRIGAQSDNKSSSSSYSSSSSSPSSSSLLLSEASSTTAATILSTSPQSPWLFTSYSFPYLYYPYLYPYPHYPYNYHTYTQISPMVLLGTSCFEQYGEQFTNNTNNQEQQINELLFANFGNLDKLPLYKLIRLNQINVGWVELQRKEIMARQELTLLIGPSPQLSPNNHHKKSQLSINNDPINLIQNSLIGDGNRLSLLEMSRLEPWPLLNHAITYWLISSMPSVRTLQISANFAHLTLAERHQTLEQIEHLILHWGPQLLDLKLWFAGLSMIYQSQSRNLYSDLAKFWPVFNQSVFPSLVSLSIDIQEEIEEEEGVDEPTNDQAVEDIIKENYLTPKFSSIPLDLPVLGGHHMERFRFAATNYSVWKSIKKYGDKLNEIDLAACFKLEMLVVHIGSNDGDNNDNEDNEILPIHFYPKFTQIGIIYGIVEENINQLTMQSNHKRRVGQQQYQNNHHKITMLDTLWERFVSLRKLSINMSDCCSLSSSSSFLQILQSGLDKLSNLIELRIQIGPLAPLFDENDLISIKELYNNYHDDHNSNNDNNYKASPSEQQQPQKLILKSIKTLVIYKNWLRRHDYEMNLAPVVRIFPNLEVLALNIQLAQCIMCKSRDKCARAMLQPLFFGQQEQQQSLRPILSSIRKISVEYGDVYEHEEERDGGDGDNNDGFCLYF